MARIVDLVALDENAPRVFEMAGERVTARGITRTMTELTGTPFFPQWAGTTSLQAAAGRMGRRLSKDREYSR